MGTFTLIESTSMRNYNKAERLNLLKRFMALMPGTTQGGGGDDGDGEGGSPLSAATEGVPALNISAEQVEQMNTLIDQMSELTMQATSAAETPEMQQLEADRDVAANYIVRRIADYDRLPLATEREAARRLEPVVRPYAGIASLPVSQETEVIRGLAADLAKPDLADDVTTLGLAPYIAEMQRLNEAYAQLAAQRDKERSTRTGTPDSKTLAAQAQADAIVREAEGRALAVRQTTEAELSALSERYQELLHAFETASSHVTGELRRMDVAVGQLPLAFNRMSGILRELRQEAAGKETD